MITGIFHIDLAIFLALVLFIYIKHVAPIIIEFLRIRWGYFKYIRFRKNSQIEEGWIDASQGIKFGSGDVKVSKDVNIGKDFVFYKGSTPYLFFDENFNQLKVKEAEIHVKELNLEDIEHLINRAYRVGKSFSMLMSDNKITLILIFLLILGFVMVVVNVYIAYMLKTQISQMLAEFAQKQQIIIANTTQIV